MASAATVADSTGSQPLSIDALVKRFGAVTAVDGVSLEVHAGRMPRPARPQRRRQKHAHSRHRRPRHSRLRPASRVFGARAGSTAARAALGWVPQELAVYPRLTCKENLHAFGSYHGLSGKQLAESVAWCLEWAALEDRAGDLAGKLSGGMKRRLNMAAGIIHRPRLVLMDEPTVGVDPQSRNRIFEMIEALRAAGHGHRLHHPLHGRSRAPLRSHRHHRSRPHHRPRHQGRAGAQRLRLAQPGAGALCRALRRTSPPGSSAAAAAWSTASRSSPSSAPIEIAALLETLPTRRPRTRRRLAAPPQSRIRLPSPHRKGAARMILPIVRTAIVSLRRDRAALALSFRAAHRLLLHLRRHLRRPARLHAQSQSHPGRSGPERRLAATGPRASQRESSLIVSHPSATSKDKTAPPDYTAATAEAAVKAGDAPVALIIPKGFGQNPIAFGPDRNSSAADSAAQRLQRPHRSADGDGLAAESRHDLHAGFHGRTGNEIHRALSRRTHA